MDLLTLAIDDACASLGVRLAPGDVVRAGRPQNPALMTDERAHLLRWPAVLEEFAARIAEVDEALVGVRRQVRSLADDSEERLACTARAANLWVLRRDLVLARAQVLADLAARARCVVTTVHGYVSAEVLHDRPYEVTVVDETSMVPAAAAARLLADDRGGFVFGGDFMQLPPVCLAAARSGAAAAWLGGSLFDVMGLLDPRTRRELRDGGALAQLREQSRMPAAICDVVSRTFYDGMLTTVGQVLPPPSEHGWPDAPLVVIDPSETPPPDGVTVRAWTGLRKGKSCERTGAIVHALVKALLSRGTVPDGILACAPYRAQARRLEAMAEELGEAAVRAGTIHRTQGAEAHTVIFDPVQPAGWFLRDSNVAANLINVAVSRTRTQLFVVARPRELRANPMLKSLAAAATLWVPDWTRLLAASRDSVVPRKRPVGKRPVRSSENHRLHS